jgi:chromosome segregation ATPase
MSHPWAIFRFNMILSEPLQRLMRSVFNCTYRSDSKTDMAASQANIVDLRAEVANLRSQLEKNEAEQDAAKAVEAARRVDIASEESQAQIQRLNQQLKEKDAELQDLVEVSKGFWISWPNAR